jgi:DNA-binding NtrC family response regulator
LEYAVIMCPGPFILPEHLPARFLETPWAPEAANRALPAGTWKEVMQQTEYQLLRQALSACQGNKSQAIRKLGLSRKAFYDKLRRYGLA